MDRPSANVLPRRTREKSVDSRRLGDGLGQGALAAALVGRAAPAAGLVRTTGSAVHVAAARVNRSATGLQL